MDLHEVAQSYLGQLTAQGEAVVADFNRDAQWTRRATLALSRLGLSLFPEHEAVTKGHDKHLGLDVTIVKPNDFSVPVFIGEHESSPRRARIQFDAWRLLCLDAKVRVLIAYYGRGTELATFADLHAAMSDVAREHLGKELLVIAAESSASPKTMAELHLVHQYIAIGQDTDVSRTHRSG